MAASQEAENHVDERLDLIFTIKDIRTLRKFSSSNRATQFKNRLLWNISKVMTKTDPVSARLISCEM